MTNPDTTQSHTVTVELSPDEHAKLQADADKAGQTLVEYASSKLAGRKAAKKG